MEERIKAIELALKNEKNERDFYLRQSERTQNPVGKKMFACIAEDENEHYERLKALHAELSAQGSWPDQIAGVIKDTNIQQVLDSISTIAADSDTSDADDIEAVKIAIDFETNGYNFYSKLKDDAVSAEEKSFFARLASIEKEHLNSLKDTLLFFEDPETWYLQHEKPHLEG